MTLVKPTNKPTNPNFSSGPCAKRPGWEFSVLKNTPIGRLVTRTVNDIETIASIFSQGLFMIIADLLQMFLVVLVKIYVNFELTLIVL